MSIRCGTMRAGLWLIVMVMALLPFAAGAAKLGNLTLLSALDQPLRAEIEVVAAEDEYESLAVRLVHLENLSSERSENALVAAGVRFTMERRSGGEPFVRVTSERPIKEQFIDMFVEVVSVRGKRVHGYSFLLDAPRLYETPAAPVAVPEVKKEPVPIAAPKPVEPASAGEPMAAKAVAQPDAAPAVRAPTPARESAAPAATTAAAAARTRLVARGDTLGKIAQDTKAEDVGLFQMLLALLRGNEHAFVGGNMNRLLAGKLLSIPDRDTAIAVDKAEARDVFVTQAAEFDAYRQRLAETLASGSGREDGGGKSAEGGKTQPATGQEGRDKLEISKANSAKGKTGSAGASSAAEEDRIASEKALTEANDRIAELEKTLADFKKLAALNERNKAVDPSKLAVPAAAASAAKGAPGLVEQYGGIAGALALMLLLLGYLRVRSSRAKASRRSRFADAG